MIKKKDISKEDIEVWNNYIKDPQDIVDKDVLSQKKNQPKQARYKFDLHGYTLLEANNKVKDIILSSVEKNYEEILLVTGKGIHSNTEEDIYTSKDFSKLKYSVPEYIRSNTDLSKFIKSISGADKRDGGDGAIIITLKKTIE